MYYVLPIKGDIYRTNFIYLNFLIYFFNTVQITDTISFEVTIYAGEFTARSHTYM